MARAIRVIKRKEPTPAEVQAQSLVELTAAVAEHKDALLATLKLAQQLQESGALEMLTALLAARAEVGKVLLHQVTKPAMTNTMNNAMALGGLLGQLDPEVTKRLVAGISSGVESAAAALEQPKKVGVVDLLKVMGDPGVNKALGLGLAFVQGMGAKL